MERWLGRYAEYVYAIMRIVVGFLFACHGAMKLFGAFGGEPKTPEMFVAGIVEFFGGVLVVFGLWAGFAAFLMSGEMAVAYFQVHAPRGPWPILNKGEMAVLYSFVFLYIACKGSGVWSVDALIAGRHRSPASAPPSVP
jgi:putative oxidoreductase